MTPLNVWALAALLALLALLASVRLSLPTVGSAAISAGPLRLLTHSVWLVPLLLTVPMTVGLMMAGAVPVSPAMACEMIAADYGFWAGVAALVTVVTAQLWLLLTPSMIARRFARTTSPDALRFLPLLNLALGSGFLLILFYAWG